MIHFESIEIEGFGSIISKTFFSLSREGLTIIRGKVGSGKTSIPSALYWCLFGLKLKADASIETWEEIRPKDFKGTMVKTNFRIKKDKYSIVRCISYKGNIINKKKGGSGLFIIKNDEIQEIKGKKGIQAEIQTLIQYSANLFINSIIYGQKIKRIIESSGPDKKKLFDEAFETIFVDKAKAKTEADRKNTLSLISQMLDKEVNVEQHLNELKNGYKDMIKFEKTFKDKKQGNLKNCKTNIAKYKSKVETIQQKISAIQILKTREIKDKVEKSEKKLKNILFKLELYDSLSAKMEGIQEKIDKATKNRKKLKSKTCYECGSILNTKEIKLLESKINDRVNKLKDKVSTLSQEISEIDFVWLTSEKVEIQDKLKELEKSLNNIKSNKRLKEELENSLSELNDTLGREYKNYKKIKDEKLVIKSDKYESKIEKKRKELRIIQNEMATLNKEKEVLDWLIKEPLSNAGIKAYIFNSLLDKVNSRLETYSEILGFRVEFGIDMESTNKDFYQVIYRDASLFNQTGDIIINYPDLSGGQKQLVDTAVALAIHDVIASVRPTNILFLDEPFEGLDSETIELVSEIITYKSSSQSLYLITHHTSFNPTNADTLYFTLGPEGNTVIQ